jgi:hypothetical protein
MLDIKEVVDRKSKVLIYGDASMAPFELERDAYPPREAGQAFLKSTTMPGKDCLEWLVENSDSTVG